MFYWCQWHLSGLLEPSLHDNVQLLAYNPPASDPGWFSLQLIFRAKEQVWLCTLVNCTAKTSLVLQT